MMRWTGHVAKLEGKRPLGRPRRRWVDNIKMGLREIWCRNVVWIDMAEDKGPVESPCEDGNEPSGSIKCREVLE
jgi:hypothetical protein